MSAGVHKEDAKQRAGATGIAVLRTMAVVVLSLTLAATALTAGSSRVKVMIRSDPPGATVYTQDAQGAWKIWGSTPFALTVEVPNPWSECAQTDVVRVQWPSGASKGWARLSVCPKDTVREFMFERPDGPGRDLDDPIARARPFSIFVGPRVRERFVDVDKGVLDSIQDILGELRGSKRFTIVRSPDAAVLQLFVVGRRIAGQGDSYGVPIGGLFYTTSVKRRAIDTILRVGTYEKATTSEDPSSDTWTGAAQRVVKDLTAWVEANRATLSTAK